MERCNTDFQILWPIKKPESLSVFFLASQSRMPQSNEAETDGGRGKLQSTSLNLSPPLWLSSVYSRPN